MLQFSIDIVLDMLDHKLSAAIQEWRTGQHKAVDFSANTYLDVYNGRENTFHHIRENRKEAFHATMRNIFLKAR